MDLEIERIPSLSNDELFRVMKECKLNIGPITDTTRGLYEKKLKTFLSNQTKTSKKENRAVVADIPVEVSSKSTVDAKRDDSNKKKYVETVTFSDTQYDKEKHTKTTISVTDSTSVEVSNDKKVNLQVKNHEKNILVNISNSFKDAEVNKEVKIAPVLVQKDVLTTKDDINVKFVRSNDSSFTSARHTFSTPQTDKFANRLNSYGLLRQQINDDNNDKNTLSSSTKAPVMKLSYAPIASNLTASQKATFNNLGIHKSQQQRRDESPKSKPVVVKKSPENHRIFSSSIVRDNSPTVTTQTTSRNTHRFSTNKEHETVQQPKQQQQQCKKQIDDTIGLNWKYLIIVGVATIVMYFTIISLQTSEDL